MTDRHAVEMVQKVERSFLIFQGKLVCVITFCERQAVAMMKSFVQAAHFAKSLMRTLDREKIEHRSCYQHGPRIQ